MKRKIISWLMLLLPLNVAFAQDSYWQCNIYDYQYDMTAYVDVTVDGVAVSDYSNYEVAAFCGEECRGVASVEEIPNAEKKYYYLRIRSNQNEGETISFKVHDKVNEKEYAIANVAMIFSSQSMQGFPSSPVVLGAANIYRLTYTLDGAEYSVDSIVYGTELVQKEALTKEGHTFSGWSEIPATMPAQDVTIEGTFTVDRYRLVYLLDGTEYSVDSIAYGTELVQKEALTKEGHTFSGWSELPATMPAKDVTISGSFTANKYAVVYTLDGETFCTDSVTFGDAIVLVEAPAKEGYTFAGWSEVPATMPAKDVTVTGTYTVNQYTLTYTVDGVEYKKVTLDYGAAISVETEPTKEGYTFSGWSELPATMPAKDITATGSYTVNKYTLLYLVDGEEYKKLEVEFGTTIVAVAEPTKEGYIFSGWSEIPETMPAKDVTVTGSFEVDVIDVVVTNRLVDVYTLQGIMVRQQVPVENLGKELPAGIYIVNNKMMIIR